ERVNIHSTGIERQARLLQLLIVYRHQCQIDVGLRPDGIVRQAAAEDSRQDRPILFHLRDKIVERIGELFLDGLCLSAHCSRLWSAPPFPRVIRMLSTDASGVIAYVLCFRSRWRWWCGPCS